ncbi:hypothetical protein BU26DRAFT_186132 [Trematosphaeria pertusa]|uniref:Uncharacterized protein n=1 Tax=Trematosphaeria pertusa TaxID=390896 RepID=A0A6A6HU21_9PLEO|nr:uncharacterized protein BU26DRAFT_186132 [Trematosphaeria pertusa]KAF2241023.1 hypothetical protein BU26DRAFT_186132 [Trematosphaeria pertusa]
MFPPSVDAGKATNGIGPSSTTGTETLLTADPVQQSKVHNVRRPEAPAVQNIGCSSISGVGFPPTRLPSRFEWFNTNRCFERHFASCYSVGISEGLQILRRAKYLFLLIREQRGHTLGPFLNQNRTIIPASSQCTMRRNASKIRSGLHLVHGVDGNPH